MSTVYSTQRPQLSPSELRCSPHTTYYTNFFVLTMAVIINGQQAEIGFSENKEITLNCRYPTTECMSINFDTISQVEAVLKKHGVNHVSNFWVGDVPFFQVGFSSEHGLKTFLCSQQEMQREVGPLISVKLREGQPLAASPSPVSQGFPVEVETELFLVLPEAEDNIRAVSMENCNSCLALWKESEKFDFGAIFRTFRLKEGRATVDRNGKLSVNVLVSELSDVVDWFHLGLYLGVPHPVLLTVETDHRGQTKRCKTEMIGWWANNEEMTWSTVVRALVGIRMRGLAEKIAVKYNVAMPTDAEQRALEALPLQTEASHSTSFLVASLEKLRSDNGKKDEQLEKVLETLKLEFQEKAKAKRKLSRSKRELMTARNKMTSLSRKRKEAERMLQLKEKELFFLQQVAIKGSRDLNDVIESKKAEIAQLREQLGGVNSKLSRAREEAQQMREKLQQKTIELEKQATYVRELERARADLERERSRVDMMLKQLCDRNQSERVAPTELDTLKKAIAEKEKEVERLSSQLETKETEKQKLLEQAAKQSQHEEELEDRLVQLTAEISDLTASLVEAKDVSAKAEVEVEDLKSRQSVIAEMEPVPPGTRVIAKYNFRGPASHMGDMLEVVSASKDPNWYRARRYDGLEGMIPYNYVDVMANIMVKQPLPTPSAPALIPYHAPVTLRSMPWYHEDIGYKEAERLLNPLMNGQFLLSDSEHYKGDFDLCISWNRKVEHYHVLRNHKNFVSVDDEECFENLAILVEHYQKDADGLCCRLKHPVYKTSGNIEYAISLEDFEERGWSIPSRQLDKGSLIGNGEFVEVWQGEYKGSKVSIKMLKDNKDHKAIQQLLAEASIMTALRHPNLVCLIGVSLDSTPPYLVTEYMEKGSLVDYLRSRGRTVISKKNQLDFAKEVCKGMVYLESQNYVHRDLAARNVQISGDNLVKISDFSLTRKMDTIILSDDPKLPSVKWTAPEAIRENKFSNKSDVWSFGVLLWEIYSYGRTPYPHVMAEEVATKIDGGLRMDAPDGCPDQIYHIMQECWGKDPSLRPNFARIEKYLDSVPLVS